MTTKHTPGPWEMRGPCASGRYSVIHNGPLFYVGDAGEPGDGEANARLAAAAPELLEALREIHNAIADGDGDYSPSGDWFKQTAAIIAKATGQEI